MSLWPQQTEIFLKHNIKMLIIYENIHKLNFNTVNYVQWSKGINFQFVFLVHATYVTDLRSPTWDPVGPPTVGNWSSNHQEYKYEDAAADQLHDGLLAPGWRIGSRVTSSSGEGKCLLLLGVLQHQLLSSLDPLSNQLRRAFASTPSHILTDVWWLVSV